jgi:tRNA-Thr(GGU) m(6)t(6)A37 methyltransferase TsaA
MADAEYFIRVIGRVRSSLKALEQAPRQGSEGAPRASLVFDDEFVDGLVGIRTGDEVIVLTWLHLGKRDVLTVRPRNDPALALAGVFATRSPDRPNPIGLHRVRVLSIASASVEVEPLEAVDGTPIVDLKPVWNGADP